MPRHCEGREVATGRSHWRGRALVVGAGGLGQALIAALDVLDNSSLISLGHQLSVDGVPLRLVIVCIGLLHGDTRAPEERLEQVSRTGRS